MVSVVLPCHQAAPFVREAMESLTRQTYSDLEILALDDGSTDETRAILDRYAGTDRRVRVIASDVNRGLVATLNQGVAQSGGEFIARMDADDISRPDRIRKQVELLRAHPDVGVVSVGAELMGPDGRAIRGMPVRCASPDGARFMGLFAIPLVHAAIVARAEVLKSHPYATDTVAVHTEDYELFSRMLRSGVKLANVDERLYSIRVHGASVSRRFEGIQVDHFVTCARLHLEQVLGEAVPQAPHRVLVNRISDVVQAADLRAGLRLLDRLESLHELQSPSARNEIGAIAAQQRADILIQALLKGAPAVRRAAVPLSLRYLPGFLTPSSVRYVLSKFGPRGIPR
ncbi:MAG TPA: glycosyltransferase family 2 protein [Longimicrobiales bacterium]|nr:glycosyltransferase family 2 protein [Longimicrobiales bacterium]